MDAVPRDADGKGEVTQHDVCVPNAGVITKITLRYMMSSYFGDPIRQAVFAYYADFSIGDALWVAQVFTTAGQPVMVNGKPVYVSWEEGSWPQPGGAFGSDSTGSPFWNSTFVFYDGGTQTTDYVDETNAKAIYQAGFTLDKLRIITVDKNDVLY